jgi:hypothetical protein
MEKRHIISLQGRDFVTYEGLLDEAHAKGLRSIRTQLVQIPTEANGNVAICTAEIEMADEGQIRTFTGIGDANPRNVSRNVAAHLVRMAETRAKARALRDAINVGMAAFEELEEAELGREVGEGKGAASRGNLSIVPREEARAGGKAAPEAQGVPMATRAQIDKVSREMRRSGFTADQGRGYLLQQFGKTSRLELTSTEIEAFLAYLKELPDAEVPASHG